MYAYSAQPILQLMRKQLQLQLLQGPPRHCAHATSMLNCCSHKKMFDLKKGQRKNNSDDQHDSCDSCRTNQCAAGDHRRVAKLLNVCRPNYAATEAADASADVASVTAALLLRAAGLCSLLDSTTVCSNPGCSHESNQHWRLQEFPPAALHHRCTHARNLQNGRSAATAHPPRHRTSSYGSALSHRTEGPSTYNAWHAPHGFIPAPTMPTRCRPHLTSAHRSVHPVGLG